MMQKRPNPGSPYDAMVRFFESIGRAHGANGAATEGLPLAADFLGVTHWTLRKQIDPDQPSDIGFGRVAQLTRQFGCTEAAEHMALCAGGVFLPVPDAPGRIGALSAEVMRETGEAIAKLFASLSEVSDGGTRLTRAEAIAALPEVREALASMTNLYREVESVAATPPRRTGR